jgi:hypothetical protein
MGLAQQLLQLHQPQQESTVFKIRTPTPTPTNSPVPKSAPDTDFAPISEEPEEPETTESATGKFLT